jgi:predicted transcriptional regulator
MSKKLIEIAAEIVQTQVSLSSMSASEIASSLRQVFSTLQDLQHVETKGVDLEGSQASLEAAAEESPKQIAPMESIQENKVICLECGAEMKQLTQKHLVSHDMNQREYKKKYGFTMRTPLAAKSLTKARSKAARKRGLPENLKKYHEERKAKAAAPSAVPSAPPTGTATRSRLRKKGTV